MAGRNRSGSNLRPNHHRFEESVSRHPRRILTFTEVHILDERIAAQSREIEAILLDNRRLAASHVALKDDMAAQQQELRHLSTEASTAKAERDAQVREVYEQSLKVEAEARSIDVERLSTELERVRAGIKEQRDERMELSDKLKDIEGEISRSQPELKEFSDLKTEIEAWQKEIRRGRAAIEYERKMCSNNFELSEAMEKHKNTLAGEAEKLCSELSNAEQRAMAAVVDPVLSANQGPGYAIHQPGYGGNSLSDHHAVHYVAVSDTNQGPGYAIHQPGYGGNSLFNHHAVHHVAVSDANQGPGYAIHQPGYGGNSLSDHHAAHHVAVSDANQGPVYAIQQPGYGGNSLSDPHVVHQITVSVANQGPGHAINQPEYDGNPLSDPLVVHQGKSPNKKRKGRSNKKGRLENWEKNETNTQGKKPKCPKCKKKHIGECLFGKKVCFKCKEPGHISASCPSIKGEKLEIEGKGQVSAST